MGLVSFNKRFLAACVDAPWSMHDAHHLRHMKAFTDIAGGKILPDKAIHLEEEYGDIPTIGDCAFPRHAWLFKTFPDTARDEKEKLFNLKLHLARVVTENC